MNSTRSFVMMEQAPQLYKRTTVRCYGCLDMTFMEKSSSNLEPRGVLEGGNATCSGGRGVKDEAHAAIRVEFSVADESRRDEDSEFCLLSMSFDDEARTYDG